MESQNIIQDVVETYTENNNQPFTIDKEILLSILPSNVWTYTFQKLEKKHPSSLESLSNSSLYFRNLILSKRVLFLFPQIIKLIGPEFANQTNTRIEGSNIIRSRTICKAWNNAIDQFIVDDTLEPDFFNTEPLQPSDHALVNARYQYFEQSSPPTLPQFLEHFLQTHLPHFSRNPFIGKVVHIDLIGPRGRAGMAAVTDQVSTLLRKYGHHIKILNLCTYIDHTDPNVRRDNHEWLLECLENCPNLTHLKLIEQFNAQGQIDVAFGERPDPRRRGPEDMGDFQLQQQLNDLSNIFAHAINHCRNFRRMGNFPQERGPQNEPMDANQINQGPTLQNLKWLKLCQLTYLIFNTLISANTHVVWLQIEPLNFEKDRYIDFLSLEFPNLKKLSIKLFSPTDVRNLRNAHESWLQLTHLHFEYCLSSEFMEWSEIFEVINENWGNTLTDLKLKLPMAGSEEDKEILTRDSSQCRLNMPRLKRLKIWLRGRLGEASVAKTDFLDLVKEQLEQLIIE